MKNLFYKELRLSIHPMFYLATLFGALVLIPNWLYFIAISYIFYISISNIFANNKAQNDIAFSVLLPVRKKDVVKARVLSIAMLEILHLIVAAFFGYLNHLLYHRDNFLLEPNAAFIGFGFVMYGLFNIIFFPMFYKTAYKIGIPIIVATFAALIFATGIELACVYIPWAKQAFDAADPAMVLWKAGALAGGFILFVLMTGIAAKISARRFERIDL